MIKIQPLPRLRPYQYEISKAVLDSVFLEKGLTFSVEIARQGGKNELSARMEKLLLARNSDKQLQLVKCSPTFQPQTVISMRRLKDRLNDTGFSGHWSSEMDYIVRLGEARALFLSADGTSNVVGNTAHLLLEIDESQDIDPDKYTKDFKPMTASTNCTVVHYGTTWDDSTLLESVKQTNLELERKDGIKRHFQYDYLEVGKYNPQYLLNVEMEKQRLGENHPLFLTQYRLLPMRGGGGFLDSGHKDRLQGSHSRQSHPSSPSPQTYNLKLRTYNSPVYVASIDLAGESETGEDTLFRTLHPKRDSTVITIAELDFNSSSLVSPGSGSGILVPSSGVALPSPPRRVATCRLPYYEMPREWPLPPRPVPAPLSPIPAQAGIQSPASGSPLRTRNSKLPVIRILEHYSWTGCKHVELFEQMVHLLKNVWNCKYVLVDATGMGEPIAAFLAKEIGSAVVPFTFTAPSKSQLGFNLLAAINSERLKMYAADNSPEYKEFWYQMEKAKSFYRTSQTLNFFVNPSDGHDDFLMSLALLVESASLYEDRHAYCYFP